MKLKLPLLVTVVALALATSACTSTPAPTATPTAFATNPVVTATPSPVDTDATDDSTPTPDSATYPTVDDLRAAFIAAGGSCTDYTKVTTVAKATGAATCGSKYTLAVFATAADPDVVVNASGAKKSPYLMLVGANWLVIAASQHQFDTFTALLLKLGGFIVPQGS